MSEHLIRRVTILGTGLIGGSFALALRKDLTDISISGWDRPDVVREKEVRNVFDETFSGNLGLALAKADLIYVALPIAVTLDLFSEIARHAPASALVTDACSTKLRIMEEAGQLFGGNIGGAIFLGGHPMAGKELSGIAAADADLFRGHSYALIAAGEAIATPTASEPRIAAFVKILEKIGAQPLWIGAQQHDYAVGLAGSPYSTWRDIILTNKELLSASLDLFARRLDDLRERLGSRDLEADFDAANELYKLLRSL